VRRIARDGINDRSQMRHEMFWVNPYSQRNQRGRWLSPDARKLPAPAIVTPQPRDRRYAEFKNAATDWRAMHEDLRMLSWQVKDLRAYLALRRLSFKYNPDVDDQPRDERGRWSKTGRGDEAGKDGGPLGSTVTAPSESRFPLPIPRLLVGVPPEMNPAVHDAIDARIKQYNLQSELNRPDLRAILQFNAAAFEPDATPGRAAVHTGMLTRDDVRAACPRYWEVQELTNTAAFLKVRGAYQTPQEWGTAVHMWVRDEINGPPTVPPSPPRDPNFRSELSVIKGQEADRYGQRGSKRVDVYENPGTGTVCVYDIKTGEAGLSFARMRELATNVGTFYPGTQRIVVTQVRPWR